MDLSHDACVRWLRETDAERLKPLYREADAVRAREVGDDVHLRGLVELSNHCARLCGYCGLRADRDSLTRYRMSTEEVLDCVRNAAAFGYGTVVLQAGEDYGLTQAWVTDLIRQIKSETDLAVTLSLGERPDDDLRVWKEASADRYLLRFETSNRALYDRIHPPLGETQSDRLAILRHLRTLGYEVGSGVMIGIPGQSFDDLADDLALFRELDLDMIGVGPFILHPETPAAAFPPLGDGEQVPATEEMAYKMIALARLLCPKANIPSTTAIATLNKATGRELGLQRGANVVMPNLTPPKYRALYQIYPAKACLDETAEECRSCMRGRIHSIGRHVGRGRGDSPNRQRPDRPA